MTLLSRADIQCPLSVLQRFLYKKIYENFVGTLETVRNREVSALYRCPYREVRLQTMMHLVYLLKFCLTIVFDFSQDNCCNSEGKPETMIMQDVFFLRGRGGGGQGVNKVHYGTCENGEYIQERKEKLYSTNINPKQRTTKDRKRIC